MSNSRRTILTLSGPLAGASAVDIAAFPQADNQNWNDTGLYGPPDRAMPAIRTMLQGRGSQLFRLLSAVLLLSGLCLPQQIWGQTVSSTLPLSPSDWTLAYSGQDASLPFVFRDEVVLLTQKVVLYRSGKPRF